MSFGLRDNSRKELIHSMIYILEDSKVLTNLPLNSSITVTDQVDLKRALLAISRLT